MLYRANTKTKTSWRILIALTGLLASSYSQTILFKPQNIKLPPIEMFSLGIYLDNSSSSE
jgi:hypothetical protein